MDPFTGKRTEFLSWAFPEGAPGPHARSSDDVDTMLRECAAAFAHLDDYLLPGVYDLRPLIGTLDYGELFFLRECPWEKLERDAGWPLDQPPLDVFARVDRSRVSLYVLDGAI